MRAGLLVALWALFGAASIVGATVLLRACGIALPLSSVLPASGWNFCPSTPLPLSAETERGTALRRQVRQLERELADKAVACASISKPPPPPFELPTRSERPRPQQTAQLKPPPPPPPPQPFEPPKPPAALPADRWAQKELTVLQGCWNLGRETSSLYNTLSFGKETCRTPAARLCFDGTGGGQYEERDICPRSGNHQCTGQIQAQFSNDGTIVAAQPETLCPGDIPWGALTLICRRADDSTALCDKHNANGNIYRDLEFRR